MATKLKKELFYHILFWVAYSGVFTFVEGGYDNRFLDAFYIELIYLPFRLAVVYFNYFFLLPGFFFKKQFGRYLTTTLISIAIAAFLHRITMYFLLYDILYPEWNPGSFWQAYRFLQAALIITSPMVFLIGVRVMLRSAQTESRAEQLEKEKLKAELGYLRSQINPHFFFNTLNNLYGLAMKKSDKTPEVVMKLSELMSYVLYEADREKVALEREIEQIERYIALEKIRYDSRFEAALTIEGETEGIQIPPLLLLPFVENSFKHGVNKSSSDGWISVFIGITGNELRFTIKNKTTGEPEATPEHNGLGLANTKKRLQLLFPGDHTLRCEQLEGMFVADLRLGINTGRNHEG